MIMSTSEIATDTATFDEAVRGDDMVIAKFQTKACVICRRLEPGLKQVTGGLTEALCVIDVDAEENTALAERYEIRGVPTLILFKNGRELTRCKGFQSASMLREWVTPHVE
jgi:thioredoxin-like negative regulator of GroEL